MKTIKQFTFRAASLLATILLILISALPGIGQAGGFQSDDFSSCAINNQLWAPGGVLPVSIGSAFSSESAAVFSIPAGQDYTFSGKNKFAPRIIQNATDTSFEAEVKFLSALGQTPTDTFNIQGFLVRGTSPTAGKSKILRFDLNSNGTNLNFYIGYFDENGNLTGLVNRKNISTDVNASPIYLRVKYDQPSGTWNFGYALNDLATFQYVYEFKEVSAPGIPGGITFDVSGIGIFAASTSNSPTSTAPGLESNADYFKNMSDSSFTDDPFTLTVQKVGFGNVSQTCSGNIVTLTAQPDPGVTFTGWTGDVTGSQNPINLTMDQSHSVTANFSGEPIDLPFSLNIPIVQR